MNQRRVRRPSAAMVVATIALVVSLTGTAVAARQLVSGDKLIRQRSLSGSRLRNHTVTGKQINLGKLGTVPRAAHAATADEAMHAATADEATHAATADDAIHAATADDATHAATADDATHATTADEATQATSAGTATNATQLGGSPPSAFQSRVSGACTAGSGIQRVNADGTVSCGSLSIYSGRIVTALNAPTTTVFTIPGIAHLVSLNCQAGGANAELENDGKTTDIWLGGDTNYVGTNWLGTNTPYAMTGGATWHLGSGSGAGATVVTVTASVEDTGSSCIFQGLAQVMTS